MTNHELAKQLRELGKRLQRDDRYNPKTEFIIEIKTNGIARFGGRNLVFQIAPVLRDGYRHGALKALSISATSGDGGMVEAIFFALEQRGLSVWGFDPNKGAIERLADAIDAVGEVDAIKQIEFAQISGLTPGAVSKLAKRRVPMTLTEATRHKTASKAAKRSIGSSEHEETDAEVEAKFRRVGE